MPVASKNGRLFAGAQLAPQLRFLVRDLGLNLFRKFPDYVIPLLLGEQEAERLEVFVEEVHRLFFKQ